MGVGARGCFLGDSEHTLQCRHVGERIPNICYNVVCLVVVFTPRSVLRDSFQGNYCTPTVNKRLQCPPLTTRLSAMLFAVKTFQCGIHSPGGDFIAWRSRGVSYGGVPLRGGLILGRLHHNHITFAS